MNRMVKKHFIAAIPQAFYWNVVFYSNIPSHIIRLKLILLYSLLWSLSISLIKDIYLADMLPAVAVYLRSHTGKRVNAY